MSDLSTLQQAKSACDDISKKFQYLATNMPEGWQREYVDLRRAVQVRLIEIGAAGRSVIGASGDPGPLRDFEDRLSRCRHTLAFHQASWPVVSIDPASPDYQHSLGKVQAAYLALAAIIDQICACMQD